MIWLAMENSEVQKMFYCKPFTCVKKHTDVFENSSYLQDVFIQTKGKTLNYKDRLGNIETILINNPKDIYSIMEQTFKIQ